jgi:hypothetical protein
MYQRAFAHLRNRPVSQSIYGRAIGAATLPSGLCADAQTAISAPRGMLMAVVDVPGDAAASRRAIERIAQTYESIPPDVDRLIALRATLDQAKQSLPTRSRQTNAAILIATVMNEHWYGIAEGAVCGYHVLANGQLKALRLGPTGQSKLAAKDRILICTQVVTKPLNDYDIALSLYAHSPEHAVQRLLTFAERRGQRSGLAAVACGPRRSLITTILSRLSGAG